jgi:hypothetical protein
VGVRAQGKDLNWTEWYYKTVEAGLLDPKDWSAKVVAPKVGGPPNPHFDNLSRAEGWLLLWPRDVDIVLRVDRPLAGLAISFERMAPQVSKLTFARNASSIGIGQQRPTLSWRYDQSDKTTNDWTQTAFELSLT